MRGPAFAAVLAPAIVATAACLPATAGAAKAPKTATLGGVVWIDADTDGRRDRGEAGARGVRVEVERRGARRRFTRVAVRRTNAKGRWTLPIRVTGVYRVRVVLPASAAGFSPANRGADSTDSDVARSGRATTGRLRTRGRSRRLDAGIVPRTPPAATLPGATPPADPSAITGLTWNDLDGDGVRDPGEPPRADVTVELWDAGRTTSLASTQSGPDGRWGLTAPAVSEAYRVRVALPAASFYSPEGGGSAVDDDGPNTGFSFPVLAGRSGVEIGIRSGSPITIGGFVWNDADDNGLQEAGSVGLAAVGVELWNETLTQRLGQTLTDAAGLYTLPAQAGGAYRIKVTPPSGLMIGRPNKGANDAIDSDLLRVAPDAGLTATLRPAASTTSVDAAFLAGTPVGDRVWNDLDGDGVQEPGEPGVAGVVVQLWNSSKTLLHDSDVTTATGGYQLRAATAGDYRVRVVLPSGTTFTTQDVGGDEFDSDINTSGSSLGFTFIFPVGAAAITTVDAGIRQ